MVNLLNTMGIYRQTIVPYAAVLMIELRLNDEGIHVVTVSLARQNASKRTACIDYEQSEKYVPIV